MRRITLIIMFLLIVIFSISPSLLTSANLLSDLGLSCYQSGNDVFIIDGDNPSGTHLEPTCVDSSDVSSISRYSCIDGVLSVVFEECLYSCNDNNLCNEGSIGSGCGKGTECATGYCDTSNYICTNGSIGSGCFDNSECARGICDNNICISPMNVSTSIPLLSSEDFSIVIGSTAKPADNIAAIDLAGKFGIQSTINDYQTNINDNLIIVGGPCVNTIAADLMGNPADCSEGFEPGKGMIKVFKNGGNIRILVAGYDAIDTRIATRALVNYQDYNMNSNPIITYGTSLDDVNVE
jgi:hypothetical protein